MNHLNVGHRVGAFQLPEPDRTCTGQLTPDLICRSTRLPTEHIGDLPATTEGGLQATGAFSTGWSQHSQLLPTQAREAGKTNGFRSGKHPGVNPSSGEPGSGGGNDIFLFDQLNKSEN